MFISDLLKDKNKFEELLLNIIVKYGRKYKKIDELIKFSNKVSTVYSYIINVSKKPFPEKEWLIAQDEVYSYHYAKNILKGRFEKGEEIISKNGYYAFHYTKDVIKGRWEKGEDTISKSSVYSYYYARDVLKDRFKKGEGAIIKDKTNLKKYISFLKSIKKLNEFLKDYPEIKIKI